MIGIIVVSHGDLAKSLLSSAEMLVGKSEQMTSVCLYPGNTPELFKKSLEEGIKKIDTGDGIIALGDLLGGTPLNTIYLFSKEKNLDIKIIAGVNIGMILTASLERESGKDLSQIADLIYSSGLESIKLI